jgi:hypothetical protein
MKRYAANPRVLLRFAGYWFDLASCRFCIAFWFILSKSMVRQVGHWFVAGLAYCFDTTLLFH